MTKRTLTNLSILVGLVFALVVQATDPAPRPGALKLGTEAFGLTPRALV